MEPPTPGAPVVALLALPESTPMALFGLYEVFLSAGRTWAELTGEETAAQTIEPRIVSLNRKTIGSPVGIDIVPHDALCEADVVIVTDLAISGTFAPHGRWIGEIAWLRERYASGSVVCSVCTGALIFAEAGILDGQIATTHWSAADLIKMNYPEITLAPERIMTAAGEGDRIITCGGASSWEDLALYLVARFCGAQEAIRVSKIFLFGDRAEGQLPFAGAKKAQSHSDRIIADVQTWIADHYNSGNAVAAMARRAGLSERTFNRRFRSATGYSPMEYLQTLRLEEAKHVLETTDQPIDNIAQGVGYADPTFFRRLFKRKAGITPARYRQRFSRIGRLATDP